MAQVFIKDSDADLDYKFDWNDDNDPWLATGETISSHVITAETGITAYNDSEADGVVKIWIKGGTAGERYDIACKIVTSAARTDERTIIIRCTNR